MLAQNKAIFSRCGDLGITTARAIVAAVGGVISMLQMVDSPSVNVIYAFAMICALCPAPNLVLTGFWILVTWHLHRSDSIFSCSTLWCLTLDHNAVYL